MAGSAWTCERCDSVNDAGARVCEACGGPAPPPVSNRSRAWWVLVILVLLAAATVGATILIAAHRPAPTTPAARIPVYTTPVIPSTTKAAVTSTTTASPPTTATTSAVGTPCPAAAAQYLPGGAGTALLVARTEKSVITICETADGKLFYDGQARDAEPSADTHITLPAQRSDDGFVAVNGEYHYTIREGRLVVSVGSRVLLDDALTPVS